MTARNAAIAAVRDALNRRAYVRDTLRAAQSARRIDVRSAATATQLALGALRRAITIDTILSAVARYQANRVPVALRAVLYAASYELIWMDTPIHAAVDQAVGGATRIAGRGGGAMVNALLRALSGQILERAAPWLPLDPRRVRRGFADACLFRRDVLPTASGDPPLAHLAAATSERPARFRVLVERFGACAAEQVAWASLATPILVLRRNVRRAAREVFVDRISAEFPGAEICDDAAFAHPGGWTGDSSLIREGLAFVQDQTAHEAARLLAALPGERVLDLCAAPGGKTAVIAGAMDGRGEIVACDVSPPRLARLEENVSRLGLSCATLRLAPVGCLQADLGVFDAAIVDVPCSNSGVLARRPEARLRLRPQTIAELAQMQFELLHRAARVVRTGGRLVYTTCSIEPEENGQVVERFLSTNSDWRLDQSRLTLPAWGPSPTDWRDGGFAALLRHG
ncbi:MAG: transcription antitermination factor NusB [Phycisphaerae bacterium]